MISWKIEENGFDKEKATGLGNKFLTGNGYLGIRGTPEEFKKEGFPAVNLAGIYDQVGNGWREPLNAPNGLFTRIRLEKEEYCLGEKECLSHSMSLDYRHGLFGRETKFATEKGELLLRTERFASMDEKHLICLAVKLRPSFDGCLEIVTGVDGDVWDINGPHYDRVDTADLGDSIRALGITHENQDQVVVCEAAEASQLPEETIEASDRKIFRHWKLSVKAGEEISFYKFISIYTSKDCEDFEQQAQSLVKRAKESGYEKLLKRHMDCWEEKWNISEVLIEGDDEAMEALNYSLYHLHCIAPRHSESLSIAARGLSGQTYKGAVFWDTEMFMLDFFLFTEPEVAKTLLKYRIDTLPGAKKKAESYGFSGAFYAWESQEGGYDACSDYNVTDVFTGRPMRTYFKDKQIHISAAVAYGIMRYTEFTGKDDLLREGGGEVILECAKFYYSLLVKRVNREVYELWDVIGPDEYHERVNNNAYTNRMAKFTLDAAVKILENESGNEPEQESENEQGKESGNKSEKESGNESGKESENGTKKERNPEALGKAKESHRIQADRELLAKFKDAAAHLYMPAPDEESRVIQQFDGYEQLEETTVSEVKGRLLHEKEYWGGAYGVASHTKVIKQADVVTMVNLFSREYDKETIYRNWAYYEPRTEHGSSLSACMYSMVACKCDMPDKAYPFFIKSAKADLQDGGKQWAGLIYIGGTHPAASGGAYMTAVEGFGGIRIEDGVLKAEARLPKGWNRMEFKIYYLGDLHQVTITREEARIQKITGKKL